MDSGVLAEFDSPDALARAHDRLRARGYERLRSWTPYPVRSIVRQTPESPVPWLMLVAGLLGAGFGYAVQWWCNANDYPLNVGGRPLNSAPAFIPITFESGVLAASVTGFFAMLVVCGLPRLVHPVFTVDGFERAFDRSASGSASTPRIPASTSRSPRSSGASARSGASAFPPREARREGPGGNGRSARAGRAARSGRGVPHRADARDAGPSPRTDARPGEGARLRARRDPAARNVDATSPRRHAPLRRGGRPGHGARDNGPRGRATGPTEYRSRSTGLSSRAAAAASRCLLRHLPRHAG